MVESTVYRFSVMLATTVGAAGLLLALLARGRFRDAPFGRSLSVLPLFMFSFSFYHFLLLAAPSLQRVALFFEAVAFALLVIFVATMIRLHARMSRASAETGVPKESP